jgi:hypothetical protein
MWLEPVIVHVQLVADVACGIRRGMYNIFSPWRSIKKCNHVSSKDCPFLYHVAANDRLVFPFLAPLNAFF